MQRAFFRAAIALITLGSITANAASELQNYVQQCESELQFSASQVQPMNCNNGVHFAGAGSITLVNDYLLYQQVNDNVDLVAACRWIDLNDPISSYNTTRAASIELIIHNRQNAETCFFQAKDTYTDISFPRRAVATAIVSPTNFSPFHSSTNPNADDYWQSPTALNNKLMLSDRTVDANGVPTAMDPVQCVGCHSQGPYIASQDIVRYLARYGLLNDRHDTATNLGSPAKHYHAVGSISTPPYNNLPVFPAFQNWDNIVASNDSNPVYPSCAVCHALASNSQIGSLFDANGDSTRVLPSIQSDIVNLMSSGDPAMPPYQDASEYRWINLDNPADGVETENFADAIGASNTPVPLLLSGCAAPGNLEAHAVKVPTELSFSTSELAQLPDHLRTFNLKEGLVCLNSDQEGGRPCNNYKVRYLCADDGMSETWSGWYDHFPLADGDHEERYRASGACGGNPLAIQAEVTANGVTADVMGPNDRLARFSPYGLTCNNADQVDGKCSNYVVRYEACNTPPSSYPAKIYGAWSANFLTASNGSNNAAAKAQPYNSGWNTQDWIIEPVPNTEYVRIRNKGTGTYLNVTTQSEAATVVTYALNTGWTSEEWIIEGVPQSDLVRFKNLWTGKYLTMADQSNYSAIYSQGLNTGWISQKWSIN